MGSMLFMIMAALAQMEREIKRERVVDAFSKRRDARLPSAPGSAESRTARCAAHYTSSKDVSQLPRSPDPAAPLYHRAHDFFGVIGD